MISLNLAGAALPIMRPADLNAISSVGMNL